MDYNKQEIDGMDEKELRMYKASLRQTLISKRENLRREQDRLSKEDLDVKYLSRQKEQLNEDVGSKEGKIKAIDNEIYLLISKRENLRREQDRLSKEDLDVKYLSRQKEQLNEDVGSKEGKIKAIDNEIYLLTENLENSKLTKKGLEIDIVRLKKQSSDMDYQIKNRNRELEELRYEIRELEQDIRRMETETRSI